MSEFTVTWEVQDGYTGKSRPQFSSFYLDDFNGCETVKDIIAELEAGIGDDFSSFISWSSRDIDQVAEAILEELGNV